MAKQPFYRVALKIGVGFFILTAILSVLSWTRGEGGDENVYMLRLWMTGVSFMGLIMTTTALTLTK